MSTNLHNILCCTTCGKRIHPNFTKHILCYICKQPRHLKCTAFTTIATATDTICYICIGEIFPFCNIESDQEFYSAIMSKENSCIDHHLLASIKHEFKCDFTNIAVTEDYDIDADTNYYNTLFNNPTNYFETANLNLLTLKSPSNTPQFIMHINARSLSKNISNIVIELSLLTNKPSIIAVSETWAVTDNDNLPIPGYSNILKARKYKSGGGVGLYIKDEIALSYKVRPDLEIDSISDSLFIQTINKNTKSMIIGVIYKPPDIDVTKFTENLDKTLTIILKERRPCYLLGDFNINLLKHNSHSPTNNFLNTLLAHGFFPLINKPTRITTDSITLIDNILTNVHDLQMNSGIWVVDISDHLPVFTILPKRNKTSMTKKIIQKRSFTKENQDKFKNLLQIQDWHSLNNIPNVNNMYSTFTHIIQKLYSKAFPIQTLRLKSTEIYRPWLTKAIRNSIRKKHSLYKNYQKLRSIESHSAYKVYRNKLTTILRKAEKMYYLHKLESVKQNCAKTWKILNSIISRTPKRETLEEIVHNNKTIRDPKQIANNFNSFFTNVGTNLATKIPSTKHKFTEYLKPSILNSIFLKPVDELELQEVTRSLKNSYSKGHDDLSINTIKNCCTQLSEPLCKIFNKSIQDGIVPDDLKIAKIIPIYKSDNRKTVSNYRPISVLPALSKILERLVYNRLLDFIDKNHILSDSQYGFRKRISTSMALIDLVDNISSSIAKNEYALGIFLDLAKAFDTVNHDILLEKLHRYGIRGIPYNWFKNYLSNRHQYVYLNNTKSDQLPITCGVPQGSILGPLLFLLYINDLNTISNQLTIVMFADDTNIFINGKNLLKLTEIANNELDKINNWFSANLLSLNIKKTNYILFGNKKLNDIPLAINKEIITRVYETKFLGILIQSTLKWDSHICLLKNKISKSIGIINKAKNILGTAHLKILYHSLIEPYLNYCSIVWGNPEKTTALETLHKLQKRAIRLILYAEYRAHTKPLFSKLNILNIYDIIRTQILTFVYKSYNSLLPIKYSNYFTRPNEIHHYATRSAKNFSLYRITAQKSCRINTLASRGPKYWNLLPIIVKTASPLSSFKSKLREHLISQYLTV